MHGTSSLVFTMYQLSFAPRFFLRPEKVMYLLVSIKKLMSMTPEGERLLGIPRDHLVLWVDLRTAWNFNQRSLTVPSGMSS